MNTQHKHSQTIRSPRGFTIIEVVLVLAIAGLIFLMVFLALPALQKGQRDTQRREDLSRISTQINSYSSNARGKIPTESNLGSGFVAKYLGEGATTSTTGDEYADPSGSNYMVVYNNDEEIGSPSDATVYYSTGQLCNDDNPGNTKSGKTRNYTLRLKLENQKTPYCIDNR